MIELTGSNGLKIYLNPDHISAFYQREGETKVFLVGVMDDCFCVKEIPEEIIKLMPPKAW
jgi:uncharacterized protein YlzI (FlbEa/FlbD family)